MNTYFKSITAIEAANKKLGHYWFQKEAVSFFNSKIESGVVNGHFFVHSSQFTGSDGQSFPRQYKVAFVLSNGIIETVGLDHKTRDEAVAWLEDHVDSFSDQGDGVSSRNGEQLHVRFPIDDHNTAFLNSEDVTSENRGRKLEDRHLFYDLVNKPLVRRVVTEVQSNV